MKRWNGCGDGAVSAPLNERALAYLHDVLGPATVPQDASFDVVAAVIEPSRLAGKPGIDTSAQTRLLHARGQSLPDWLALRFGRIDRVPDGVAFPESSQDVRDLLDRAKRRGAHVIPYGGGTSVVGHINPLPGDAPVLTVSLERMRRLLDLDEQSGLATFGAGVTGPDLEAQLRAHGFTLGHFPQSFEYSTLGGWIVTRSSGQQSRRYGRIEALFAGGRIETPVGTLRIPTVPASAAGIDVREMVLGSEGRMGIVTEATVRVRRVPQRESFHGWFFPNWESAERAVQELARSDASFSMMRLANPMETLTTLRLAGSPMVDLLERYLALRGCRAEKSLLLLGITGERDACDLALRTAEAIARTHRGVYAGKRLGERWRHNRFRGVYLRNALWEAGYAVDTAETAVDWPRVGAMMTGIEAAARAALAPEAAHVYTHLSHVYAQGSSVYSTFIFRIAPDYETNLRRWTALKAAVSDAIVEHRGTISHQHGVGIDHQPYLAAEKGALGIDAMRSLFARFDPDGMMNPGKLC
ncbi:MAG TPA: FAD-binding oxidoreductase [Candidatus Baltobacteraceae bacterium]|nr:FAD-binding oxidoreductase [Candidatus Baltobacteraceae bacterium]